jgi:hypothetical protein
MILKLVVLDLLAVHAALIGMQGFVAIGKHHVFSDLVLCDVGAGARPGSLSVSACSSSLFASSVGHGFLPFPNRTRLAAGLLLLRRFRLLRLVAALAGIIVLVVIALLIHPAAAYRPFALPYAGFCLVKGTPFIGNVRLSFEDTNLLFVGLLALH